jgi:hypothetical protein
VAQLRLVKIVERGAVAPGRRLPLRVTPTPGEAIDSWLEVTARDMDLPLGAVARAWLTFNVLHFMYHMSMLQMYNTRDAVLNVVTLSVLVLIPAALLIPLRTSKVTHGS